MRKRIWLAAFLLLSTVISRAVLPPPGTLLAWDRVANVAGYRLYMGTATRAYSNTVQVGNTNEVSLNNLTNGVRYYFAVTAYDTNGIESDFSTELAYAPGQPSFNNVLLGLTITPQKQAILSGSGASANHQFDIEASSNFLSWSTIGTAVADASGKFSVVVGNAAASRAMFYRARDTSP